MNVRRRLRWILGCCLFINLAIVCGASPAIYLKIVLAPMLSGVVENDDVLFWTQTFGRAATLALILIPLKLRPGLRELCGWSFKWDRTVLLLLPLPAIYLIFLDWHHSINFHPDARSALAAAVAGGLTEEVVFRGYMLQSLGSPQDARLSIGLSSISFGMMHLFGLVTRNPSDVWIHAGMACVFGLTWGIVRVSTGSLSWCVCAHVLVNVLISLGSRADSHVGYLLSVALCCVAACVGVLWRHPGLGICRRAPVTV